MEKAPPPLPPKPVIQPKAPSPLPQTSYVSYTAEPSVAKPPIPQQAQKTQPSIGSSQKTKSSSLRTDGNSSSSVSKQVGISQDSNSSTKADNFDKARNGRRIS
jgi:hypothetical protein